MTDPIEHARPFLQQCGSCDAGLPMSCTCPTGDYRPAMLALVEEVRTLRRDLAILYPVGRMYLDALAADPRNEYLSLSDAMATSMVEDVVNRFEENQ